MNVAVVMGGYSDESVISLRSGQLILNHLDKTKYQAFEVHVLKDEWYCLIDSIKYPINKADFTFNKDNQTVKFDIAVNTVHGTPGEDGHLQAYWELIDLPYSGCNYYQSSLTFNKRDTLSVLSKFNIPKAKSIYITKGETIDGKAIEAGLGLPFFVKPANATLSSCRMLKSSTTLLPALPMKRSAPNLPDNVSLPAPPVRVSFPAPACR